MILLENFVRVEPSQDGRPEAVILAICSLIRLLQSSRRHSIPISTVYLLNLLDDRF